MDLNPSVLFVSCVDDDPAVYLIRQIIGELPDPSYTEKGIVSYPWHIDTKYYSADVNLSVLNVKTLSSPEFAGSVHGIVIYFDSEKASSLKTVEEWLVYLNEYEADIKILVCRQCKEQSETGPSKREVQEWCLEKEFELVELEDAAEDSDPSDFPESTGVSRICQALHAHVWPNLVMKDRKEPTTMAGLLNKGKCKSTGEDYEDMTCNITPDNIEPSLDDIVGQENVDFCKLFSQLSTMKDRASNMPNEERKKYAEQLVLSYWKAIGGDEDEILDC